MRITGIGSNFILSDSAANLVGETDILEGHQKLWTSSSWVYAPPPCQYSGVGRTPPRAIGFSGKHPGGALYQGGRFRIPSMYFDTLDFAYELRTPNPLGMSPGFTPVRCPTPSALAVISHLGPMMVPDDSNLTLDFVLDVQHTLKVDLPPGGNKVSLEPEGGWQRWIEAVASPSRSTGTRLFYHVGVVALQSHDAVQLDRRHPLQAVQPAGYHRGGNHASPCPTGSIGPGGGHGQLDPLRHNTWTGPFQPGHYVDRKAGSLRFEMPRDAIDFLLRPGLSDTFSGNITIIWDSEV